jgi:hypothetical protein
MSSQSGARKGRGGDPKPLGALLGGAREVSAERSGAALDPDKWRRAVGARISARARPGRVQARTLTVYVASSVWAQELSLLGPEMLTRLRAVGLDVDGVRFRVDAALGRARPTQRRALPKPDTSRLPADLAEKLLAIDDLELRAAVASAAAAWLARTPSRKGR